MHDRRRRAGLVAVLVALLAACTSGGPGSDATAVARRPDVVRVASFDFAESELLGEIFAQALEREGIEVERFLGLGSREVVEPALQQGQVDVVPEYLAAALDFESFSAYNPNTAEDALPLLLTELAGSGVTVLPHARAIDRDAIAMSAERADELGVRSIFDLRRYAAHLDFVGPPECPERTTCLPRLEADYGLRFTSFTALPAGLPIALALESGEADVGLMFSSDPLVADHGLVLLTDDRGFGRPEHVVPFVRDDVLAEHGPAVTDAFGRITSRLTTSKLVALNRQAIRGTPIDVVAREWLDDIGAGPA
jgi:osmoprotectant transport system substrate-binding protein